MGKYGIKPKLDPTVKFTLTPQEEQMLEMERHGVPRRVIAELLGCTLSNIGRTIAIAAEKERSNIRIDTLKRKHGDTTLQQARHPNNSGGKA